MLCWCPCRRFNLFVLTFFAEQRRSCTVICFLGDKFLSSSNAIFHLRAAVEVEAAARRLASQGACRELIVLIPFLTFHHSDGSYSNRKKSMMSVKWNSLSQRAENGDDLLIVHGRTRTERNNCIAMEYIYPEASSLITPFSEWQIILVLIYLRIYLVPSPNTD